VRILVFGHVSDTGFGVVTERLAERFIGAGHDVRVIAVNHRGEPIRGPLAGRVWPAAIAGQPYGGNVSSGAIDGSFWTSLDRSDDWQPERVLVIADMSGLYGHLPPGGINAAWKSVPVFHYCPIEGDNLPLGWREVWKHFTPVAMSDYGARVIGDFIGPAGQPHLPRRRHRALPAGLDERADPLRRLLVPHEGRRQGGLQHQARPADRAAHRPQRRAQVLRPPVHGDDPGSSTPCRRST
jgi:hypothetical protein